MYDRADACVRTLREHRIKEMDSKELSDDIDADDIVDEKHVPLTYCIGNCKGRKTFSN